MSRLIIVSNRLPVSLVRKKNSWEFKHSAGGLATGVGALMDKKYDVRWIGWPGVANEKLSPKYKTAIRHDLNDRGYAPVFINQSDLDGYYAGFSNRTIWPLFHYFIQYATYDPAHWKAYVRVNEMFARAVAKVMKPGDNIWVHDYHLLLLPRLLRQHERNIAVGFFLHIPFPSYEIFRLLPWRQEILEGILGADLVGFHTYDYERHFLSCLRNRLGLEHSLGRVMVDNRVVKVDTFPMGIDYNKYAASEQTPAVKRRIDSLSKNLTAGSKHRIILSVDRLDYSKGIIERLNSFDRFIEKYHSFRGKVTLILVAVPSRTKVEQYRELKRTLDELVGRINGKHGDIGWIPVWYYYRLLDFSELSALYNLADVALITPVRDGMNLIAKEYVAARRDGTGVLILSEMAGAARELSEALIVNPNNVEQVAEAIHAALSMPRQEQIRRNRSMQERVRRYNVEYWANDFIRSLETIKEHERWIENRKLTAVIAEDIGARYRKARHRILLLDYDGTLREFVAVPQQAIPDRSLLDTIATLAADPKNEIVIISGRDKSTLGRWFRDVPVNLVAEHGVWIKKKGGIWELIEPIANFWKDEIRPILERYVDRTPGSHIEEKDYSLVWHYRKSDTELGDIRARELKEALVHFTTNLGLGVLEGHKVVEIKNAGINKGHASLKWVGNEYYDFIFCAGDDRTDEDMFQVMPPHAVTVKIGMPPTEAHYTAENAGTLRALLRSMAYGEGTPTR